jgi:hypothetical protein
MVSLLFREQVIEHTQVDGLDRHLGDRRSRLLGHHLLHGSYRD